MAEEITIFVFYNCCLFYFVGENIFYFSNLYVYKPGYVYAVIVPKILWISLKNKKLNEAGNDKITIYNK